MLCYLTGVNFQDIIDVEEIGVQSASSFSGLVMNLSHPSRGLTYASLADPQYVSRDE